MPEAAHSGRGASNRPRDGIARVFHAASGGPGLGRVKNTEPFAGAFGAAEQTEPQGHRLRKMSDVENLTPPADPAPAARKRKHETPTISIGRHGAFRAVSANADVAGSPSGSPSAAEAIMEAVPLAKRLRVRPAEAFEAAMELITKAEDEAIELKREAESERSMALTEAGSLRLAAERVAEAEAEAVKREAVELKRLAQAEARQLREAALAEAAKIRFAVHRAYTSRTLGRVGLGLGLGVR